MKIGTVVGTVVSTINHELFDNRRLLICDYLEPEGTAASGYVIAADTVDAGLGDTVLIIDEGNSSRQIFEVATGPIRALVVGVVDQIDVGGGQP